MKKSILRRAGAGTLSLAMLMTLAPNAAVINAADTAASGKVIYSTDFEDGDVSYFSNRGGDDTTELSASTEASVSGSTALLASGRSESWNGPSFRLDTVCEPNTEYLVSAKIKGRYYTSAMLSFQYNNSDGETKYNNLVRNLNGSDWQEVKDVKVSFTDDMSDVYVYFEGGSDDLFIDDFSIVEVPAIDIESDIPSLREVYHDSFKVGTAITPDNLSSKPFMALVQKHFGDSITVGNEMKPDSVLNKAACQAYFEETGDDETPQISFSAAKPILNYCKNNNIPVRVHTLVWHSQTPDWFFKEGYDDEGAWVSKEKMLKRMENYIKAYFETLTELYPTVDFYACDVVNEAWTDGGTPREAGQQGNSGSEQSAWVKVFGDNSFIEPAFTYARKYAPKDCKLYYNDYNEYMTGKMEAICKMAEGLKEKGLIDGIGMQSHLDARQSLDASFPSPAMYKNAIATYSKLGLDIQITELDATVNENTGDTLLDVQAEYYSQIFDAIYEYRDNISAVILWGVTDDRSWRASQQPLLFGGDYMAKPCFFSIVDGIDYTPTEPTEPITAESTTGSDPTIPMIYGDVDLDLDVTINDVVNILCHAANPSKNPISAEAQKRGDVYQNGDGINALDATSIQKFLADIITELPESYL